MTTLLVEGEHVLLPIQGRQQALVESRSRPGQWHCVSFEWNDDRGLEEWTCTCEAFTFRHECRHVVAVDRWNAGLAKAELIDA